MNLRIPGPIPVPADILDAMSKPMINHRGPEFKDLLHRVTDRLKRVFDTGGDVYLFAASGTGALEAAVVNTLSPGDRVLSASAGAFGDRFGDIAEAYGADVIRLGVPWGAAVSSDEVRSALGANDDVDAVLITHNETSTGVTMDLESIAKVVKDEFDKLLLVDGVSSVCSLPLRTDDWRCDVVATASQKGWGVPPGLAFISFSERAWRAHAEARMPRFYFDVAAYKRYFEAGQTPFTPTLSVMFALDVVLDRILDEGMESVFERHARIGSMVREGVRRLGLSLFADERVASNTVTAVNVPEGVDARQLMGIMRERHNVVLAGGQQSLSGRIFRVGHMGFCAPEEIVETLDALEATLRQLGFTPAVGTPQEA